MESYQHVLDTLRDILDDSVLGLALDTINPDSDLTGELGIDSLTMCEIADMAQEKWSIKISDEEINQFTTVDSMVTFIQAATAKQERPVMTES